MYQLEHTMRRTGVRLGLFASLATLVLAPASAMGAVADSPRALQAQVSKQMTDAPGGVRIAANKVSYDGGNAVVVFPLPGQASIPSAADQPAGTTASAAPVTALDVHGCPDGFSVHWYCFYADANYGGRSLQFKDCASGSGYTNIFSEYAFQNQTTSWVNARHSGLVQAYQGSSTFLWQETPTSSDPNVGAALNDQADRSVCFI